MSTASGKVPIKKKSAGKQPKTSVVARAMSMLALLPQKPPGITAQQITDDLANRHRDYAVDKRTVERDLVQLSSHFPIVCAEEHTPYQWYWMPGASPMLQQIVHRLAGVRSTGGHRHVVSRKASPIRLTPIQDFAANMRVPISEILEDIQSGSLNGAMIGSRWYELELTELLIPDRNRLDKALLRIAATQTRSQLTLGPGVVEIALTYDEAEINAANESLFRALDRKATGFERIVLGRKTYAIHDSLWLAIGQSLTAWQVDREVVNMLSKMGAVPITS